MAQMGDNNAALQLLSRFASLPGDIQQGREDYKINVEKCLKIALEKSLRREATQASSEVQAAHP